MGLLYYRSSHFEVSGKRFDENSLDAKIWETDSMLPVYSKLPTSESLHLLFLVVLMES